MAKCWNFELLAESIVWYPGKIIGFIDHLLWQKAIHLILSADLLGAKFKLNLLRVFTKTVISKTKHCFDRSIWCLFSRVGGVSEGCYVIIVMNRIIVIKIFYYAPHSCCQETLVWVDISVSLIFSCWRWTHSSSQRRWWGWRGGCCSSRGRCWWRWGGRSAHSTHSLQSDKPYSWVALQWI